MSQIYVALDFGSSREAVSSAEQLGDLVDGFKVGLQLIWSEGPGVVSDLVALGRPVFVDAKLHDIPNTVSGASRAVASLGARYVTVHATGGGRMIEAAVRALEGSGTGVLAVTTLTSLDLGDRIQVGMSEEIEKQAASLARLAESAGAVGMVCAVGEARSVKEATPSLIVVTPGIRFGGDDNDDQARVATPQAAVAAGADILVVGRSITGAPDPALAASQISSAVLGV